MISLRPHHGLCLFYFVGEGYSDEFIENMRRVSDLLNRKNALIRLTPGVDDICLACPHNIQRVCKEEPRVSRMDGKVLDLCRLKPDAFIRYSDFEDCVKNRILLAGNQNLVCAGCQWEELCHGSLSGRDSIPSTPSDISE